LSIAWLEQGLLAKIPFSQTHGRTRSAGHKFLSTLAPRKIRAPVFANLQTRQEAVIRNSASLQIIEREAVVIPLPVSMHAGRIIMLTKMFTASDLRFYDFPSGVTVETWRSDSD
jgi:hypothetical protein